jgi:hypothetical protein
VAPSASPRRPLRQAFCSVVEVTLERAGASDAAKRSSDSAIGGQPGSRRRRYRLDQQRMLSATVKRLALPQPLSHPRGKAMRQHSVHHAQPAQFSRQQHRNQAMGTGTVVIVVRHKALVPGASPRRPMVPCRCGGSTPVAPAASPPACPAGRNPRDRASRPALAPPRRDRRIGAGRRRGSPRRRRRPRRSHGRSRERCRCVTAHARPAPPDGK